MGTVQANLRQSLTLVDSTMSPSSYVHHMDLPYSLGSRTNTIVRQNSVHALKPDTWDAVYVTFHPGKRTFFE